MSPQHLAQLGQRQPGPRLDRAERQIQLLGDDAVRLVLKEVHAQHQGLLLRQRDHRSAQPPRLISPTRPDRRPGPPDRRPGPDRPDRLGAALAPQIVDPLVARDREDPGADRRLRGVVEAGPAPHGQHDLLHEVLGLLVRRAQAPHVRLHARREMREQAGERRPILPRGDRGEQVGKHRVRVGFGRFHRHAAIKMRRLDAGKMSCLERHEHPLDRSGL